MIGEFYVVNRNIDKRRRVGCRSNYFTLLTKSYLMKQNDKPQKRMDYRR